MRDKHGHVRQLLMDCLRWIAAYVVQIACKRGHGCRERWWYRRRLPRRNLGSQNTESKGPCANRASRRLQCRDEPSSTRTALRPPPNCETSGANASEFLMLIEAVTPAVINVSADPVSIQTDRRGLDAAVTLPYTPNFREPMWIQPPRHPEHGRHLRLAPTAVHKDSNAEGVRWDDSDVRRGLRYYLERSGRKSGQCMIALTSLQIKRGSGQ